MEHHKYLVFQNDYIQAKRCVSVSPHVMGLLSLLVAFGFMASVVAVAKVTIVFLWLMGITNAVVGLVGADDIVTAWEKGEGRWYRRAGENETLWE